MTTNARVVINDAAVRELLNSAGVRNDLEARARRIAAHAGPGMIAGTDTGRHRARGYVVTATPAAQEAEATNRSLTRAIDAGR